MIMEVWMKKSLQLRILATIILIGLAIVDAIAFIAPIAAIGAIILILFRPKWLFTFFEKIYDRGDTQSSNHI
jgi:hypothetical protein